MKTITLENGKKVQISEESYQAMIEASKRDKWPKAVEESKTLIENRANNLFMGWINECVWLNNKQSQKEFKIYLYKLLWKSIYDKDFEPDWVGDKENYHIHYNNYDKRWCIYGVFYAKFNMQVYVSTKEKAKQMLKDLRRVGVIND